MNELEELKQELKELEESNKAAWDTWGSELCAGDMERKERILRDKIKEIELNQEFEQSASLIKKRCNKPTF